MRLPWWARVLIVYGAARAVSALIFVVVASHQAANPWTDAAPSYSAYTGGMWDAGWYRQIADNGYPETLPRDADGTVQQNAWAFFPLYPLLVRALTGLTGLGWDVVAPTLSLLLGGAAMLTIYRLVEEGAPALAARRPGLGLATVAVASTFVAAPVLQVGYTESLALLLVSSALLLVVRGRYLWAVPVVLALGFTRPVALPIACVVVWHGVMILVRRRKELPPAAPQPATVARWAVLLVTAVAAGFVWPVVCRLVTGVPDAYFLTQEAWRGTGAVVPVVPWFTVADWLFGDVGAWLLVALLVVIAVVVLWPGARLGPEMQAWTGAYLAYLVLVLEPGTSLVRFLLLAFPLFTLLVAWTRSRAWLAAVIVAGVVGQVWWLWTLWRLVPPSGWPP